MARATNDFLSSSRRDPDGYWMGLNALRADLMAGLSELSDFVKRPLPEPGLRGRSKVEPTPERAVEATTP